MCLLLYVFFRLFIIIQIYPDFPWLSVFPSVVAFGIQTMPILCRFAFGKRKHCDKCDDEPGHRLNSVPNATTPGNTLGKLHHKTP